MKERAAESMGVAPPKNREPEFFRNADIGSLKKRQLRKEQTYLILSSLVMSAALSV